jgi:hypothetical protein
MRRLGAGPGLASSSDRGLRRGNLLDRVAHVRPVLPNPEEPRSKPVADRSEPTTSDANGNGHSTNGAKTGPENAGQGGEAAQMPQTEAIEERSKPRLRDRLIGLAKG